MERSVDLISVVARVVLLGTFLVSAWAKAVDQAGTRAAARSLGVPAALAGPCALALVVAEAALAVGLVPESTVVPAATGLILLLAAFSATIGLNLAQDNRPDCGCFGPLARRPIGATTLLRNAVLALLAVTTATTADEDLASAIVDLDRGQTAVGLLVLAAAVWLAFRMGGPGPAARPLDAGDAAPRLELQGLDGGITDVATLLEPQLPLLLVFATTTCGACDVALGTLGNWQPAVTSRLTIAYVIVGTSDQVEDLARRHGLQHVLLDPEATAMRDYRLTASPAGALVDREGLVMAVAHGHDEVIGLLLRSLGLGEVVDELVAAYGDRAGAEDDTLAPDGVGPSSTPAPRRSAVLLEHAGDLVLVDRRTRSAVLVNDSAATIWRCLDGESTCEAIAEDIGVVFGLDPDRALRDVIATVKQLAGIGMLAVGAAGAVADTADRRVR